jgi:hypothetical protein
VLAQGAAEPGGPPTAPPAATSTDASRDEAMLLMLMQWLA